MEPSNYMDGPFKNSTAINKHLKQIHASYSSSSKSIAESLLVDVLIKFIETLTSNIETLADNNKEKINSIITLSNLIHFLPKNNESNVFAKYFNNEKFLESLIKYSILNPLEDPPYLILNAYLKGDFCLKSTISSPGNHDHYHLFLSLFIQYPKILENVPQRVLHSYKNSKPSSRPKSDSGSPSPPSSASSSSSSLAKPNSSNLIKSSIEFVFLLVNIVGNPANVHFGFSIIVILRQLDFATIYINNLLSKNLLTGKLSLLCDGILMKNIVQVVNNVSNMKIDLDRNQLQSLILKKLIESIKSFHELPGTALLENMGLSANTMKYITENYDLVDVLIALQYFKNPLSYNVLRSRLFKQKYVLFYETKEEHRLFPFTKCLLEIAKLLKEHTYRSHHNANGTNSERLLMSYKTVKEVKFFILYGPGIFQLLLDQAFDYWGKSDAQTDDKHDFQVVLNLIRVALSSLSVLASSEITNNNLKEFKVSSTREYHENFSKISMFFQHHLSYEKVQEIQSEVLKKSRCTVSLSEWQETSSYDLNLIGDLKKFIMDQRLNESFKGTFCYADLSSEHNERLGGKPNSQLSDLQRIYIAISPNRSSFFYQRVTKSFKLLPDERLRLDKSNCKQVALNIIKKINVTSENNDKLLYGMNTSNRLSLMHPIRAINISGKHKLTKLTLVDGQNQPVFLFYTDNIHDAILWIDTLNLLISNNVLQQQSNNLNFTNVSQETKSHIQQLFDIKRTLQFSSFVNELRLQENDSMVKVGDVQSLNYLEIDDFDQTSSKRLARHNFLKILLHTNNEQSLRRNGSAKVISEELTNKDRENTENTAKENAEKQANHEKQRKEENEFDYDYNEMMEIANGFYYS